MPSPRTLLAGFMSVLSVCLSAHALTLAGIEVQSFKGEPLRAEISVASATAEEWGQLNVKIAPAERFAQLGLIYSPGVGQLQAEPYETRDGTQRIRITGPQSFSDNFVDLLIEVQTASGKWVKAFTLMLKPAPSKTESPVQLATAASATTKPTSVAATEHVVQKGESASQIIQQWLTEDMSTQQMLVALLKNQPEAFIEGNVNLLRAGAVLKAPSATAVQAIDANEARQFLVTQQKEFLAFSQAAAQSTQLIKGQTPSRQMSGKVGQEEAALKVAEATIDQLKLTQAQIEKQNAETRLATQRALQDAQKQLATLQSNVDQLVQLTAPAPLSVGPSVAPHRPTSEAAMGWLNLNRLLDTSHQNAYLWAALTLLGVLAVWAGLRIQARRASPTLSTLMPAADLATVHTGTLPSMKMELPADITALDLNLNASQHTSQTASQFRSPLTTETRQ
jgi:pilus assembly protein FimV